MVGIHVPDVTPAGIDLRRHVRPDDTVWWSQAAAEPLPLTTALRDQIASLNSVTCIPGWSLADTLAHRSGGFRTRSYGVLGSAAVEGPDVVCHHLSAIPRLVRSGALPVDVALVQVSPPDDRGCHSLGISVDYMPAVIDAARTVIAEVNEALPVTRGHVRIPADRFDAMWPSDRPLITVRHAPPSSTELAIARHVAGHIPDGAVIQLGVGRLAAAVAAELSSRRGLAVHSGLIEDWVIDLVEGGAVDQSTPTVGDAGPVTAGTAVGSHRLYHFLHEQPAVSLAHTDRTHGITSLAAIDRFVAVNSALEVDLTGQVNAECIGDRYVGAIGGQADFLRGAAASPGGLPIIALPSTGKEGTRSRIVTQLSGPVTTARSDVAFVVTEHGVADLRGLSLAERADALRLIADPLHRSALE